MKKKSVLKWGIMGTALISRSIIPAIRELRHNEIIAVASRTKKKAKDFSKLWKIPNAYGCYKTLLEDKQIDIVYIPLPNSLHAEWSVKAAKAGKHILCEKPLALTVNDVDRMFVTARENNVILLEALMYRHNQQTLKVKQLIDSGIIGKVCLIRGSFSLKPALHKKNIRFNPFLGGGCLWDIGYYPISFARYIIGDKPVTVYGQEIMGDSGVDEYFVGQMHFPGEIYAQFDCSFCLPSRNSMEFVGSEGVITIENAFLKSKKKEIVISKNGTTKRIVVDADEHRYLGQIKDICDAVLFNKLPRIPYEETRDNITTVNALSVSAKEGRPVSISKDFPNRLRRYY